MFNICTVQYCMYVQNRYFKTKTCTVHLYSTYVLYGTVSCNGFAIIAELVVLWGISLVEADKNKHSSRYNSNSILLLEASRG